MMRRVTIGSVLAFALLAPVPALAAGSWTNYTDGRWCFASTLDHATVEAASAKGLQFAQVNGSTLVMARVLLSPGAVANDVPATVTFTLRDGTALSFTAMTTEDYIVDADHQPTKEDLSRIAKSGGLTVTVKDVAGEVDVSVDGLDAALAELAACAAKSG